jgi:hypothetical protein
LQTASSCVASIVVLALVATACAPRTQAPLSAASPNEWREFEGSWNAAGTRRTIPLGGGRSSSVVELKGTMLLVGQGRPAVGFLAEVIALVDSDSGLVGRGVWTDEHGDQVYSELTGQGTAAKNRMQGTIVGGTGRYAGANGTYAFSWRYVVEAEDGAIQGRATELQGHVRFTPDAGSAPQ